MNQSFKIRRIFLLFGLIFFAGSLSAQDVTVRGKIVPDTGSIHAQIWIVNKTSGRFVLADASGNYSIRIKKSDGIFVSSAGYSRIIISLVDSPERAEYVINLKLKELHLQTKAATISPRRSMDEVKKDIQTLGVQKPKAQQIIDPVTSPISALYYMFSQREKDKRLVAEMENNDRMRALLKEILRYYVEEELFELSNDKFDDFIDRCPINEYTLKNSTDYELVALLKKCYIDYFKE